ncbi:MAG TPA: chemotaxis protein CheX [Desulfobacterales bacterium]|nr:chemotaxis protein CheX [Desulfobacterales bacterium]
MKVEFINPFLHAAKNVIETMCQMTVTPQKPSLKTDRLTFGEVTGIIAMHSSKITGYMFLSFEKKCILQIVANMLMEDPKREIDNEILDAVGELTNMICGGAKAQLSKLDTTFDMAQPTMVVGQGKELDHYTDAPTIVIPFATDAGTFVVEANLAML